MGRDKNRRNFSISDRVDNVLNEKSDEWDMSRSQIVEEAVIEFADHDRSARIESKVDEILDRLDEGGVPSRESTSKKEKSSSDSDSGKIQKRPDEIHEALMENVGDADVITKDDIHEAIADWWGDDTPHMREKYTPKVAGKLEAEGWHAVNNEGLWCRDEETFHEELERVWEESGQVVQGSQDPKQLEAAIDTLNGNRTELGNVGLAAKDIALRLKKCHQSKEQAERRKTRQKGRR